jgi:hypothetical protein
VAVGFNDIDGTSAVNLFAVGYQGEIWHFNGRVWRQEDSGTDVTLTRVKCGARGRVYACGLSGTLLVRKASRWHRLETDDVDEDFWGIALFKNQLWLSSDQALYVLKERVLKKVSPANRPSLSTYFLDTNGHTLWSVGEKDIAVSKDGRRWQRIEPPTFFE